MRIIYIGTSSFGIPVLKKLLSDRENVAAVITQPDRPAGRGRKIQFSPVKEVALAEKLTLYQPPSINSKSAIRQIKSLSPDLILLIAYGQILSREVLGIPALGCLNVHPSLLPKYKGPAPIHWTLIRGETSTGISFLFMNEKIDAGDIILQKKVRIDPDETYQELSSRLATLSSEIISEVLEKIKKGDIQKIPQPRKKYFYARKLTKSDCRIDWTDKGNDIYNLIRGITYIPGAYTEFKGKRIKITRASLREKAGKKQEIGQGKPGEIVDVSKEGIAVLTGDRNRIIIKRLILPGKKEMDVSQFINGYHVQVGDAFAE